jgi:hypothetical protein
VNLYFFRFAKMMAVKEARREGHSYIEPSWIASQIYHALASMVYDHLSAYRLCASLEDSGPVEVLVILYGVAVLDDAFGATEGWRRAVDALSALSDIGMFRTYSSEVSAFGCI